MLPNASLIIWVEVSFPLFFIIVFNLFYICWWLTQVYLFYLISMLGHPKGVFMLSLPNFAAEFDSQYKFNFSLSFTNQLEQLRSYRNF